MFLFDFIHTSNIYQRSYCLIVASKFTLSFPGMPQCPDIRTNIKTIIIIIFFL